MKLAKLLPASVAVLVLSSSAIAQNFFIDFDFEGVGAGSGTSVGPVSNTPFVNGSLAVTPESSGQGAYKSATDGSEVSFTFKTSPGLFTNSLLFDLVQTSANTPGAVTSVKLNGVEFASITTPNFLNGIGFHQFGIGGLSLAPDTDHTISFSSTPLPVSAGQTATPYLYLEDISIVGSVPEPTTVLGSLLGVGLVGYAGLRRRRAVTAA